MSPAGRTLRFACTLGVALLGFTATTAAAPRAPNVVVILLDDLGWGDFSCFGNQAAKTPHIDRLAREGLRFEQFYVASPICSPSRAGITTGQYPQRWRITSYLNNRAENAARGMADWLDPRAPSIARQLRAAGYATGHFGKWHLGGQRDVGNAPLPAAYGFEASLVNFEGLGPRVLPLLDAFDGNPPRRHALGSDTLGQGEVSWRPRPEVTPAFVSAALAFMDAATRAGRPFFLNLWPDDPHSPFFPSAARRGDGSKAALYRGVIEELDAQLGEFFAALRARPEWRDQTLVVLCSDNGPEFGAGSSGGLRGSKAMLYEGGVRSPLIVWGPGLIAPARAGSVNRASVLASIDLAPSLLALAGAAAPADQAFDGVDVSATLLGRAEAGRGRPLFFRRPPDRNTFSGVADLPDLAVRDGRWKLLCEYDGSRAELYDLEADPAESRDRAADFPAEVARLRTALLDWHRQMPPDLGAAYRPVGKKKG